MSITFEQLPGAIEQVNRRLENIENLLSQSARHPTKEDKLLRLTEAEYCLMSVLYTFSLKWTDLGKRLRDSFLTFNNAIWSNNNYWGLINNTIKSDYN